MLLSDHIVRELDITYDGYFIRYDPIVFKMYPLFSSTIYI